VGTDYARVACLEIVVGQTEFDWQVTAQVVEYRIGLRDQCKKCSVAIRMFQVKGDAFLVAVKRLKKMAVTRTEKMRAYAASNITAIPVIFDLDDFCAQVR
jgi:hypothetical protein